MLKRKGFNVTELIVVVTIIAGLIAILVPVLGSAREISYKVFCRNNLRQLGICVQSYAMDNKVYPVCIFDNFEWSDFLKDPNIAKNRMLGVPISLWGYHKQKELYNCPMLVRQHAEVSYCYNSRAGRELEEGETAYAFNDNTQNGISSKGKIQNIPPISPIKKDYYYLTPDRVKKPETFIILYDLPFVKQPTYNAPELFSNIDPNDSPKDPRGYLWYYPRGETAEPNRTPGPHRTGFNILFADLQVEWYRNWDGKKMRTQPD
ncbi:MAG: type II secretion system protein [Phycisphaerales bacterium]